MRIDRPGNLVIEWDAGLANPGTRVAAGLGDRILAASTLQAWEGDEATTKEKTCDYGYDSEWRPVKQWLADDGAAFRASITQGLEVIAGWINRDLEAFASETGFKKTEDSPATCYRRWRWYDNFLLF